MKRFDGFPERFEFVAIPRPFLSQVMPLIDNLDELKVILEFFNLLYQKKGSPVYVSATEIASNTSSSLDLELIVGSLERAVGHDIIIPLKYAEHETLYFLNDEHNRRVIARIKCGELQLPGISALPVSPVKPTDLPDVFNIYEQNIGLITPIIADELKEALRLYPEVWLKEAIGEAARLNKRNWRYINKILDNWATQGRNDGTYQRDITAGADKYVKGKYGRFVQR
ncbi:DnaD/phage-associated domain protein [Dehalogenimonas sp. WBC-2]|nr:DnaD/phage-associated domain protein [Dehalogenimonas sp. WBC-2]